MPRNKFNFDEVINAAKNVTTKLPYPINSVNDLAKALGGDKGDIEFGGRGYKIGHVRQLISEEYFPIESEEDLIAKIAHLLGQGGEADTDDVDFDKQVEAPERGKENPPNIPVDEKPLSRGVPAIKGWKEKKGM